MLDKNFDPWKRVREFNPEAQRINNASTPMFLVEGWKVGLAV